MRTGRAHPTFAALAALVVLAVPAANAGETAFARRATAEEAGAGAEACLAYLLRNLQDDGRFTYLQYGPPPDGGPAPEADPHEYNLLRHAGTLYALYQAYERALGREEWDAAARILAAMRRGAAYLRGTIHPMPDHPGLLAVWSPPKEDNELLPRGKLGGAGLALVALVGLERAFPGETPPETLAGLGRFVTALQRENGSFHSILLADGTPESAFVSLYYPGEAALGMARLFELDGREESLDVVRRALRWLARERETAKRYPTDHWALLATEAFLPHEPDVTVRDEVYAHAAGVLENLLAEQRLHPGDSRRDGSFYADTTLCPVAIRLEGLAAAVRFLPAREGDPDYTPERAELRARVRAAMDPSVAYLLRWQIKDGPLAGGIPRAVVPRERFPETAHEAQWPEEARRERRRKDENAQRFNARVNEVRVDYVQHALSAFVAYEALVKTSP